MFKTALNAPNVPYCRPLADTVFAAALPACKNDTDVAVGFRQLLRRLAVAVGDKSPMVDVILDDCYQWFCHKYITDHHRLNHSLYNLTEQVMPELRLQAFASSPRRLVRRPHFTVVLDVGSMSVRFSNLHGEASMAVLE
jgi:hypothetical protein